MTTGITNKRMATSQMTPAKDLRECAVCLEDMITKEPKFLECKHSYCMECLSGLAVQHGSSALKITCPKCKHVTVVKSGSLSNLPDNFLLHQVKAVLDDHTQYHYCFFCCKSDVEQRAVSLCTTCHRYMCKECMGKHKTFKKFQNHRVMLVKIENKKDHEHCQKHNEPIGYVCMECRPVRRLCDVCLTVNESCHSDNDFVDYSDYLKVLTQEKANLRSLLDQQTSIDTDFTDIKNEAQRDIKRLCTNIQSTTQSLDALKNTLAFQIEESFNIKTLNRGREAIKEANGRGEELLRNDNKEVTEIRNACEEILRNFYRFSGERKKVKVLRLSKNVEEEVQKEFSKFRQTICRIFRPKPSLVSCTCVEGFVSKLRASRDGRVLYVCHGYKYITELSPNKKPRYLETKHGTEYGCNIALDVFDNHLFITCKESKKAKLSIKLYKSEQSAEVSHPLCCDGTLLYERPFWYISDICVPKEDNIILAWPNGNLYRYNSESCEMKRCKIPYQDRHIHLTSVKLEQVQGFIATYMTRKAVILYDTEGNEMQKISKEGSPLKDPRATTINNQGNILIADSEHCKIVEMTLRGEFVQDILTKDDGLQYPVNVVYNHPYLWVGDWTKEGIPCLKCFSA